jgi:hypothetical protein
MLTDQSDSRTPGSAAAIAARQQTTQVAAGGVARRLSQIWLCDPVTSSR